MIAHGLRLPALVIADGAPGIWKAVRELWPDALGQVLHIHALGTVTSKLPQAPPFRGQGPMVDERANPSQFTRELGRDPVPT
jgi:hypothetical protein